MAEMLVDLEQLGWGAGVALALIAYCCVMWWLIRKILDA